LYCVDTFSVRFKTRKGIFANQFRVIKQYFEVDGFTVMAGFAISVLRDI